MLIIYGARQVGKTTLLKKYLSSTPYKYKLDSGDDIRLQDTLSSRDISRIREYAEGYELIAIDEAQEIAGIGYGLKIIVDQMPQVRIVVTGSSSFDLSQKVGEPLTGRKNTAVLYPISQGDMLSVYNRHELKEHLEEFLIFGSYPEVVTTDTRKKKAAVLLEIVHSYLFKDILSHERLKGPKVLLDLLKLLAFQVGNQVSHSELAAQLHINIRTVGRYLDLLEKSFVVTRLGGFSRNMRGEITSKAKYYFLDNGVRNAVVSQLNPLDSRNDMGALWENFIFIERLKKRVYGADYSQSYFWRTYSQKEIDLIEDRDGRLHAYEMKWSSVKTPKVPEEWKAAYPGSGFLVVTKENYLDFVL